jgi:hypothetical protein
VVVVNAEELGGFSGPVPVGVAVPAPAAEDAKPARPRVTFGMVYGESVDRMRARGRGEERMLPVPWAALARLYEERGAGDREVLRPGVHVLVGGTGSGKTQVALELAYEAASVGASVTYIGLELDRVGLVARLMGIATARGKELATASQRWPERWSSLDWPKGDVSRAALERVDEEFRARHLQALDGIRLELGSGRDGFTADDFGDVLQEVQKEATPGRPALVVLDFLQLLGANPGVRDDREIRTRIARAAYAANNATMDGRVAVLLVSATARDRYEALDGVKLGKLPRAAGLVGSGKESGEIEYSAASVLVMARPALDQEMPAELKRLVGDKKWSSVRLIAVPKGRQGAGENEAGAWALLGFDGGALYDIDPAGIRLREAQAAGVSKPGEAGGSTGSTGSKGSKRGGQAAAAGEKEEDGGMFG